MLDPEVLGLNKHLGTKPAPSRTSLLTHTHTKDGQSVKREIRVRQTRDTVPCLLQRFPVGLFWLYCS